MKPIDADALREKFADALNSTYTDDYAKGFVAGLYAALNITTLAPPNEPLTCEGCIYNHSRHDYCNYCIRRSHVSDYYRRPPEGEENIQ